MWMTLSAPLFFYFYEVSVSTNPDVFASPIILSARKTGRHFLPARSNFDNFENKFFKITLFPNFKEVFLTSQGYPHFPFYWTKYPNRDVVVDRESLTTQQLDWADGLGIFPPISCSDFLKAARDNKHENHL